LSATFAPRLLLRQRFHIVPTLFSFCLILTMTGHGGFAKTQCITYQDRRKPRLNAAASTSCTAEGAILIDPSLVVAMIHSRRVVMTPHLFPPICNIFRSVSSHLDIGIKSLRVLQGPPPWSTHIISEQNLLVKRGSLGSRCSPWLKQCFNLSALPEFSRPTSLDHEHQAITLSLNDIGEE
jgi:hypothetical protein